MEAETVTSTGVKAESGCARETREQEDVEAQQRGAGAGPPLYQQEWWWSKGSHAEGGGAVHAQITGRPRWAKGSRTWVPCTGTARTSFLCVSLSRCLGNRLVAQQPALLSPCLEPGGRSGQPWSAGSHACLRPLPVQALGKSEEGVEGNGWGGIQRGGIPCDGAGSPKARPWRGEAEINS